MHKTVIRCNCVSFEITVTLIPTIIFSGLFKEKCSIQLSSRVTEELQEGMENAEGQEKA